MKAIPTNPGLVFGKLTVVEILPRYYRLCRCECGTIKKVRKDHLIDGGVFSCGCLMAAGNGRTHGHASNKRNPTPTYYSWRAMRTRCYTVGAYNYFRYGGRGIKVCGRWKRFENFLSDMGERPNGKWLGRIDNDRDYCPANCRWETPRQQCNNKRNTIWVTFNGETLSLSDWSRRLNVNPITMQGRWKKGWRGEKLFSPIQSQYSRRTV